MPRDGQDRVALVTGANKGIGFEIARQLATHGLTVLAGARSPERGERAAAALRGEGLTATALPLDVTDEGSVERAAKRIEGEFGRLDVLVNNAGVAYDLDGPDAPALDLVRATFETNVIGLIAVTRAMLPLLARSAAPRVVNLSSRRGSIAEAVVRDSPLPEPMAYFASKAAVNAVTVAFAKQLAPLGGKVNCVAPGYCATGMTGYAGPKPAADGARIAVAMALLGDDGPSGAFLSDEGTVAW
ncbi:MAG TPA: SDR family oxidoreductase [Trebonia sp.]|jgi:NAD(P)-dependent dehydrogenase (short-subunit alcohol dehydrogenase family)